MPDAPAQPGKTAVEVLQAAADGKLKALWIAGTATARHARLRPAAARLFPYADVESIWNEHRESTRGRDLDITGLSSARLDVGPPCRPYPEGAAQGQERL